MSQFPIYDSLCQQIGDLMHQCTPNDFSDADKEYVLESVKRLDMNGLEIFYAIIRKDELAQGRQQDEHSFKQMKQGVRIDFDKLSVRTKILLHAFLKRHDAKMAEQIL